MKPGYSLNRLVFARRHAAFSMIEVLAALAIFSIAMFALIENFGQTMAIQGDLIARRQAAMLAQNVLEEASMDPNLKEGETRGDFKKTNKGYAWRLGVKKTKLRELLEVTASITWKNGRAEKECVLSTLVARREKSEGTP
jgi:general secretion pathway protein I